MLKMILLILPMLLLSGGKIPLPAHGTDSERKEILFEKVYLHIDRELYSPGDDIWFRSYLVSGIGHRLIPGYKNIYVQLVAEDGTVAAQKLLLSNGGTVKGDFRLPASLPEGKYTIRAYTRYLQNFGEESYFHKNIRVVQPRNSLEISEIVPDEKPAIIDVAFLPEGGNFVLNAINHVAFKAVDETGRGITVKGKVVDEAGNEVVSFRTSYKGMGKFIMMPQEGKNYFALIDNYPSFSYSFEPARPDGIGLSSKSDGNYLLFTLTRNLKAVQPQEFLLVAAHKGTELFSSQVKMTEFQQAMRLYKGLFPLGISQVSLFDNTGQKVAERLVFVRNANDPKIRVVVSKTDFMTREAVKVSLESLLPENDTILSSVSVSVVNEDYLSAGGNNLTMESYLLLDSELKGSIESPASFFEEEAGMTAEDKLDLVMMVNGWRSYYWNELQKYAGVELPHWADYGLTIEGNVTRLWGGKPVDYGKVVLGPFSRNFLFEEAATDENGRFSFDKLYLKDSALIMINAETKNRSRRTEIDIEQSLGFDSLVSQEFIQNMVSDISVPLKFYREIYHRRIAEQEYFKELGSILLDEVNIEGKQGPRTEDHFRLYGEPDHSFTITSDDWTYANILDYLQTKVPGLVVTGDEVRIRAGYGNPLLLLDGLEVTWDYIKYTPIGDVDKIEILKNSALMAVYGSRGGNGVIAILTKMGRGDMYNDFVRFVPGRITPRVQGFQQPRQFYSPQYSVANLKDPKPDHRPALYWNPEVDMKSGDTGIEFFTADNLSRYRVVVEGVSKSGKIIQGSAVFSVSVPRN
jgi:hypothetical protein